MFVFLRSAHSNAYYYGFGSNKRIVIFDTLISEEALPDKSSLLKKSKTAAEEGETGKSTNEGTEKETTEGSKEEVSHWYATFVTYVVR